jgi:hypothetical protein
VRVGGWVGRGGEGVRAHLVGVEGVEHGVVEGVQPVDEAELDALALLDQPGKGHRVFLVQARELGVPSVRQLAVAHHLR